MLTATIEQWDPGGLPPRLMLVSSSVRRGFTGQPLGLPDLTSWLFYAVGPSLLVAHQLQLPQKAKGVPESPTEGGGSTSLLGFADEDPGAWVQ